MPHFPGARFSILDSQLLRIRTEKVLQILHPAWQDSPLWFLASTVQHSTIKAYLSAVRSLHIDQGFDDPLVNCLMLGWVLRGIKHTQGDTLSLHLPVTDDIMAVIFKVLDLNIPDHCMFWAACNLAYFGFLRSAEVTGPNLASYLPSIHLGVADVSVDSHSSPSCLRLRIKDFKN